MKRTINRLSAAAVRNAKKDVCDGYGLWLQVSSYNTKSWLLRYMIRGKADSMGLGPLNTTSLAKARERAQKARDLIAEGINPREARDAERLQRKAENAKAMTFVACVDAYIKAHESSWKSEVHRNQWRASFHETRRGSRVFPAATAAINDLSVAAIDTALVVKVLEPIWYTTPETASRIRGRIENVLGWATVRGLRSGDNPARWEGHLKELLPSPAKVAAVVHYDALPYRDLPAFMAELRAKHTPSALALELTILTAARSGEVIGARWSEIDLATKVWTVPAERMKGGREHRVPLSDRAIAVLGAIPRESESVFAGPSDMAQAMRKVARSMRATTVHGFRSTFRDWAGNETHFPRELAEHALAHSIGDKAEQAYRREAAVERRRKLMQAWANYCERPPAERASTVTPIRERVA
jgi:integrase